MCKPSRWYEVEEDTLFIYDEPYKMNARSVSICRLSDLAFYRSNFHLRKVWG